MERKPTVRAPNHGQELTSDPVDLRSPALLPPLRWSPFARPSAIRFSPSKGEIQRRSRAGFDEAIPRRRWSLSLRARDSRQLTAPDSCFALPPSLPLSLSLSLCLSLSLRPRALGANVERRATLERRARRPLK